jgi:SOS-response transcriptional repressor LexA
MANLSKEHMLARISERLRELKMTDNEASVRAGLERTYLSQLRRKPDRWPAVNKLQAICDIIDLRLAWVTTGQGRRLNSDLDSSSDFIEVPVLSWVAASAYREANSTDVRPDLPHLVVHGLGRGDFFALTVVGDSMDLVAPEGATIIVDRSDKTLVSRGFYIFSRNRKEEATFKRWMTSPPRLEPFSTNREHQPIFVDTPPEVIGRVIMEMQHL